MISQSDEFMSDRVKLFLSKEAKKNSGIYDYTNAKILNEKKIDKKNLFD